MSEPSAGRSTHPHSDWATRTSISLHQWNNALFLQDSGAFQSAITAHWHLSLVTSDERYTTPEEWPTLPPPKIAVYFLIDTLLRIMHQGLDRLPRLGSAQQSTTVSSVYPVLFDKEKEVTQLYRGKNGFFRGLFRARFCNHLVIFVVLNFRRVWMRLRNQEPK